MTPRLRMVGAFLAIGLMATVLAAWMSAAVARVPSRVITTSEVNDGAVRWVITTHQLPGGVRIESQRTRGLSWSLRSGKCMCCGYALQFNLAAGCPECGWRRAAVPS